MKDDMGRPGGKHIVTGIVIAVVFDIVLQLFYNLLRYDDLLPYDSLWACIGSLLRNMIPCMLVLVSNYLIIFVLWGQIRKRPHLALKILADAVLSLVMLMVINQVFLIVMRAFHPDTTVDIAGTILFDIVIFMCVEIAYFANESYRMQRKRDAAREELLTYRYNLLNAQVNPHFLFNSLNNLLFLIKSNPEGACEFTRNLSRLYRHVLSVRDKSKVKLSDELDFMWQYISILTIRYNNALSVVLKGEENIGGHMILPLVLQMLIENITKHNEISAQRPMEISIEVKSDRIVVSNPMMPKCNVASSSFGLPYISECYRMQGGTMNYTDNGSVFQVTLSYLDS